MIGSVFPEAEVVIVVEAAVIGLVFPKAVVVIVVEAAVKVMVLDLMGTEDVVA